jgi:ABC-2 type transport system permease protein
MIVRRDRWLLLACVVLLAGFVLLTASSYESLYPTEVDRARLARTIEGNATFAALYGPAHGLRSIGGLTAWRTGGTLAAAVGLMSLLLVGRHTRTEEARGRAELVCAAAVERAAPLVAALTVVVIVDLVIGALVAVGLVAQGLPTTGSCVLGASLAAAGIAFAGVGAVTAQVARDARTAHGLGCAALGAAFLIRAAGDTGDGTLSWLSPLGWARATRAYDGDRWWTLLLCLALALAACAAALALLGRRDLAAGLLGDQPGSAHASPRLRSPLALALRMVRGMTIAWAAGLFVCGAVLGSMGDDVTDLLETSQGVEDLLTQAGGASVVDAFFASVLLLLALIATGYAIAVVLRLREEETGGRAELLLSTATDRRRWGMGWVAAMVVGSTLVVGAGGLGTGITYALSSHDPMELPRLVAAAAGQLPAVWTIGGLTVALVGLAPRAAPAAWAALLTCMLLWFAGPLMSTPDWLLDVSPYEHAPRLPAQVVHLPALLLLAAVPLALAAVGIAALRRRDLG